MSYIQQFFTSRDNNANAETFVGQQGRLWWDPVTNKIYYSDGSTPGGIAVSGGTGGNGTPGGSNSQVQFNDSGAFGGVSTLTFDKTTGELTTGFLSATGNVTADYFYGNGSQLTDVVATDVGILSSLSVTGNVTAGNYIGNGSSLTSTMTDRGVDQNNWDTLTQMGVYTVNRTSWSGTIGAPLDSQVYVGLLEVKNSTGTALSQIFYPGTVESGDEKLQWNRTYWNGAWSSWVKIVNDYQTVVGGVF